VVVFGFAQIGTGTRMFEQRMTPGETANHGITRRRALTRTRRIGETLRYVRAASW
jgi:hypothetical protein